MLSKLAQRARNQQQIVDISARAFRASAVTNKKPSIGDAVTILQSKVSSINQVVSGFIFAVALIENLMYLIFYLERLERIRYRYLHW